jgi:hypothetical protein
MFRFTIRELVLLTLVVAMGVGWWIDRSRLAIPFADYRRLKAEEGEQLKRRAEFYNALKYVPHRPPSGNEPRGSGKLQP